EGVQAVMLSGNKDDVVRCAANGYVFHVERLRHDISVYVVGTQFGKGGWSDVCGIQKGFVRIQSRAAIVVPARYNADLPRKEDTGNQRHRCNQENGPRPSEGPGCV